LVAQRKTTADMTPRAIQAGLLGWLLPGAGHYFLGHRGLAVVFFIAISVPYAIGLALGGVKNFASPSANHWLFLSELPVAGYTVPAYFASQAIERSLMARRERGETIDLTHYVAYYPASDVAQIYLATAGLLNILAIIDAIARAQTGGQPTFHRARAAAQEESSP
jgi:hypothetical protein